MTVKTPSESKGKFDLYKVGAEIPGDQAYRSLADGGCDFVKK
jgi:branched-chain amino acid transport system substrate-binding protein